MTLILPFEPLDSYQVIESSEENDQAIILFNLDLSDKYTLEANLP